MWNNYSKLEPTEARPVVIAEVTDACLWRYLTESEVSAGVDPDALAEDLPEARGMHVFWPDAQLVIECQDGVVGGAYIDGESVDVLEWEQPEQAMARAEACGEIPSGLVAGRWADCV